MAKAKKSKAPNKASKKKGGTKTTGEAIIDLDTPPNKEEEEGRCCGKMPEISLFW